MSRALSLPARQHQDAALSANYEIILVHISHPELEADLRISSDATERVSTDPLAYGTRSTWKGSDPASEPFLFVGMGFEVPGDQENVPAAMRMVLSLFDAGLTDRLRGVITPARVDLAICYASDPSRIEQQWLGLEVASVEGGDVITVSASRAAIEEEGAPLHTINRTGFPGLFR